MGIFLVIVVALITILWMFDTLGEILIALMALVEAQLTKGNQAIRAGYQTSKKPLLAGRWGIPIILLRC
jgi:hypothetical protein